jgi:SAM-dependent methyltransferase
MKICHACDARFSASGWDCPVCGAAPPLSEGFPNFIAPEKKNGESYDPGFYRELARLETGHFWFSSRQRLILWLLKRRFPAARFFFEIGCGTGFVLSAIQKSLPSITVSGCDLFTEGLDWARNRVPPAKLLRMDARQLYFEEEFDVVGAFDILEHVGDDHAALIEMNKALRRGGGLLISVPQHPLFWTEADKAARHVRRYRARELRTKVERAGFRVLDAVSFVSLLLPVLAAARLKNSVLRTTYSFEGELNLNPVLNAAFQIIMDIEFQLTRLGMRLPFGGSVFLAAVKI